jgi:SRSO17 transposase
MFPVLEPSEIVSDAVLVIDDTAMPKKGKHSARRSSGGTATT